MITIVDYGLGNLGSIFNMLKKIGAPARISQSPDDVVGAEKIILPGVGAFDCGAQNLASRDLIEVLKAKVLKDQTPILGICLGMQLLSLSSEEGKEKGLGLVNADFRKFPIESGRKVPHMGWNFVVTQKVSRLFFNMFSEARFYFAHSYYAVCHEPQDILLLSNYGINFVSGFEKGNVFGVQFHPEKSHKFGMKLLRNFAEQC